MRTELKQRLLKVRRWRIRQRVQGTPERPRMSVRFTGKNIYVQFIDDAAGRTLVSMSTLKKGLPEGERFKANQTSAKRIGQLAAEAAKNQGITQVVFDRSGSQFHGKVKTLADAAREAGLKF